MARLPRQHRLAGQPRCRHRRRAPWGHQPGCGARMRGRQARAGRGTAGDAPAAPCSARRLRGPRALRRRRSTLLRAVPQPALAPAARDRGRETHRAGSAVFRPAAEADFMERAMVSSCCCCWGWRSGGSGRVWASCGGARVLGLRLDLAPRAAGADTNAPRPARPPRAGAPTAGASVRVSAPERRGGRGGPRPLAAAAGGQPAALCCARVLCVQRPGRWPRRGQGAAAAAWPAAAGRAERLAAAASGSGCPSRPQALSPLATALV